MMLFQTPPPAALIGMMGALSRVTHKTLSSAQTDEDMMDVFKMDTNGKALVHNLLLSPPSELSHLYPFFFFGGWMVEKPTVYAPQELLRHPLRRRIRRDRVRHPRRDQPGRRDDQRISRPGPSAQLPTSSLTFFFPSPLLRLSVLFFFSRPLPGVAFLSVQFIATPILNSRILFFPHTAPFSTLSSSSFFCVAQLYEYSAS
jgi:hypothetical protein